MKGHTVNKHENSPDTFNEYFLPIAECITQSIKNRHTESSNDNKNPTYYLSRISDNPFPNITFKKATTREIERIINSIKVNNSHGYDGIATKMLKISAPYISSPLNYICNKSIRLGIFPTPLRHSIVKPLFKKGNRETWLIIDQFRYWPHFLRYSKKSFMKESCNILKSIIF
jgi:hypothetical protein